MGRNERVERDVEVLMKTVNQKKEKKKSPDPPQIPVP